MIRIIDELRIRERRRKGKREEESGFRPNESFEVVPKDRTLPQEARMQDHATYGPPFSQFLQVFVDTFETQVKWGIRLRQRQHFRQRDQRSSEGCKNLSDPVPLLNSGRMSNFPPSTLPSPLELSPHHLFSLQSFSQIGFSSFDSGD